MPQAAWEALLRDVVQGLRRHYAPETLRRWPQPTDPQGMGHRRPAAPPPHPTTTTPERERARAREGQGKGNDTLARGEEGPKVTGRRPQGRGTGGGAARGQETTNWQGRGRTSGRGTEEEGRMTGTRAHTQEGHATREGPATPHPGLTPRDPQRRMPAKTRRGSTDLTPHGPHQLTPTDYPTPHRGRRAQPHGEKRLQPPRKPPRTARRTPPPRPHRQTTTLAT